MYLDHYLYQNYRKLIGLILGMIVNDLQPFSVVDDVGFRRLILELEPSYKFPRRQTFSQFLLPQKYEDAKNILRKLLEKATHINLTTDSWTSLANESYISVTAHFISNNWIFFSCLLDCFVFQQSRTSKFLCEQIQNIALH